jgi:hypothetical protein
VVGIHYRGEPSAASGGDVLYEAGDDNRLTCHPKSSGGLGGRACVIPGQVLYYSVAAAVSHSPDVL